MKELDKWWASLTVAQKERIATKANKKETFYPACTAWWVEQNEETKKRIHDHCVDSHGYLLKDWVEGNPVTD